MSKYPPVKTKDLIKILSNLGFVEAKAKSTSHLVFKHLDGRRTTVSIHAKSKEIPIGTLYSIIRDLDITKERFFDLLKN